MFGLQSVFPSPYVFSSTKDWVESMLARLDFTDENEGVTRRQIEMGMGIDESKQSFTSYIVFRFFDTFRLATIWFWFPVLSIIMHMSAQVLSKVLRRTNLSFKM